MVVVPVVVLQMVVVPLVVVGRCRAAVQVGRQGWQESNLRHPVLETGALAN